MADEVINPVTHEEFQAEIDRLNLLIKQHEEQEAKLKLEAAEQTKAHEDLQAKNIEANQKAISDLSANVTDLKTMMEQQMSVDPETYTYTVQPSQEFIDKLKVKETYYKDMGVIYFSVFVGLILGYIAVKGLLGHWKQ